MRHSLPPGRKKFKCDQCRFDSDSKRGMKVHMRRSHKKVVDDKEVLR